MAQSLGLCVASVLLFCLLVSSVHSEESDDLDTAEFFIWPKLFGGLSISKSIQVNEAPPVKYSYKPVTYTAYKWVPVPYQYTVQQPFIDTSSSSSSSTAATQSPSSTTTLADSVYSTSTPATTATGSGNVARFSLNINKSFGSGVAVSTTSGNGASNSVASSSSSSASTATEESAFV